MTHIENIPILLSPFNFYRYERDKVKSITAILAHISETSVFIFYGTNYIISAVTQEVIYAKTIISMFVFY